MACGAPIVGSNTAPVTEIVKNGYNGLIVDFFSPSDVAAATTQLLNDRQLGEAFGKNARESIMEKYVLEDCLQKQMNLIKMITDGNIPF